MNEAQNEIKNKLNELSEILLKNKDELQDLVFATKLFDAYLMLFAVTSRHTIFKDENMKSAAVIGDFEYKLTKEWIANE